MEGNARPDHEAGDLSQAAQQASRTIDRVSKMARPAVERIASSAHSAVDGIASATVSAAERLGRRGSQLMDVEARMVHNTRGYIERYPLTSLGIAVVAGALLSRLLSSRDYSRY